jgi:hypothetical protein
MGFADKLMDNQNKVIYFAVLIVLVFLIVFYLRKVAGPERMQNIPNINSITGAGMGLNSDSLAQSNASGPGMRFNSQQSQPGMGLRNTAYNRDAIVTASDLGTPMPGMINQGKVDAAALEAAVDEAALNLANGASNNASSITAPANGAERLVNYRYPPQFDETWSEELQRYQAMTPPVEYAVIDVATQGYVSGGAEKFGSGANLRNTQALG